MKEMGIDISGHRSKALVELFDSYIDIVVTVCNGANTFCLVFPGARKKIHHSFSNQSSAPGSEEENLSPF